MNTLETVVREVEEAIAKGAPERRSRPLRQVTDLFVAEAPRLKDDHVVAFDEVIVRLARGVESGDRAELSRRLADIGNAPLSVVRDLAGDADPAIAGPVLERSARLGDDDLLAIAGLRGRDHLLALSRRRIVSERLADVIVKRGDTDVVRSIARNRGAKLSEWTRASLVEKAAGDADLRGVLLARQDLPEGERQGLAGTPVKSAAKIPAKMPDNPPAGKPAKGPAAGPAAAPPMSPETAREMRRMEAAVEKLASSMAGAGPERDLSEALERIARTSGKKPVQEVRVASWLKAEKVDDALAALVHNSGLPARTVVGAYEAADYEPLLLIVRAARLSWNVFKLLLTCRNGVVPPADMLKVSFESFQNLPPANGPQLQGLLAGLAADAA